MCVLSLQRVQQGFDTVQPSVSCNRQFLVSIPVPVTTFLKVACGARENPGGLGTFSEATPQTTKQRGHYAAHRY